MTCRTATYSKVSVIHEVDIPVGRLSLGGASAFFRTKSRCQNHHIWTTGKAPLECNLSLFFPRAAPSSTPATKLVRAPQMNTSRTFNEALLFYELSDENDLCSLSPIHVLPPRRQTRIFCCSPWVEPDQRKMILEEQNSFLGGFVMIKVAYWTISRSW